MSKMVAEVDAILKARQPEKILRATYDLDPKILLWLSNNDVKKLDRLTVKVGKVIKKNKKLVHKIQKQGAHKHATVQTVR